MRWIPFVATCLLFTAVTRAEKPNILFLFADDLTHEALGMRDLVDVDTPHLDKLARRSALFTHAYNMGSWSGAVCVASRTMLNTGRYVWRAQAVYGKKEMAQEQARGVLWSQLMKKAGYQTFMTGKWHVPADADAIFDVARHVRPGMPATVPQSYNRPLAGQPDPWSPYDKSLGGYWEGGKHWTEVTADDAVEFFSMAGASDKPFFMYVAFNAPHDPRQAPKKFVDQYPPSRIEVPENFLPLYPYAEEMKAGKSLRDEKLAPFPRTPEAIKVHRGEYFALITHLDEHVGRVLDALERSGKADQTWILFSADHGLAVGHHGLLGKQNMHEHSVKVPLLVSGPGLEPRQVDAPVYLQDVMATALDLAGAERPEHVEFHSLLPLARGESTEATANPVYGAYLDAQRMVIEDGWKLIAYPAAKAVRLYHLSEDPQEMHDLAEDPAQAKRIKTLFASLRRLQADLDDELDLTTAFPNL